MASEVSRGDPGVTPFHAHWNRRIDALAMGALRDEVFIAEVMRLGNSARESPWAVIALMDRRVKLGQLAPGLVLEVELRVAQREFGLQDAEPSAARFVHEPTVDLPPPPGRYGHEPTVELPVRTEAPRRVATQRIRRISQAEMASSTLVDAQPARDVPMINELAPGSVLAERYVIRSLIGDGGMGRVYKALDRQRREQFALEAHVAVKLLRERTEDPQTLARLRAEFEALKVLDHHNIVRVYDLGRDGPLDFFTMEFLAGELLSKFMTRFRGEPLPRDEAWGIIRDMGAALEHAHAAGVVHGDLTPRNVMMLRNGDIKLMDFGAAAAGDVGQVTPGYASLELLVGMPPEPRDDLFALACIGYELLDGRHPFEHRPAGEACDAGMVPPSPPGLTQTQWRWLQAALAFERKGRPASVSDLLIGLGLQAGPTAVLARAGVTRPRAAPADESIEALAKTGMAPPQAAPPARVPASPPKAAPLSIEEQFVLDSVRAAAARPEPRAPVPARPMPPASASAQAGAEQDTAPAALEKTAVLPLLVLAPAERPPPAATAPMTAPRPPTVPPNKTLLQAEARSVAAPARTPASPALTGAAPPVPAPAPVTESLAVIAPWLATAPPNKTLPLSDERTWPGTPAPPPAALERTEVLPSLIVPPTSTPAARQSVGNRPFVMEPWRANSPPSKTLPLSESRPPAPAPSATPPAALEHTAELPLLVIPPSSLPPTPPVGEAPAARVSWRDTPADGGPPSIAEPRLSPAPLVPLAITPAAKAAPLKVETWQAPAEDSPAETASWQAAAAGTELPGVVDSWRSPPSAAPAGADAWQSAVPGRESLVVESWRPPAIPRRPSLAVDDWQPYTTRTRLLALGGLVLLVAAGIGFWQAQTRDNDGEAAPVGVPATLPSAPATPPSVPATRAVPAPVPAPVTARTPAAAKPAARPAPRQVVAPPGGTVSIVPASIKVGPAARYAEIKVKRTDSSRPLTFTWWTEDGTARAGFDYLGKAKSTAYIAAGARSATLFVKIAGNSARRQPVRFTVRIARPSAGVLGEASASVTLAAR